MFRELAILLVFDQMTRLSDMSKEVDLQCHTTGQGIDQVALENREVLHHWP